jgi:DNA-binding transcriptional regulator GbsR (MarR family)
MKTADAKDRTGESPQLPPHRRAVRSAAFPLSEARWELIELCVRVTQLLGIPRSVGEIFGFIFTSDAPVTFEDVAQGLGVSNGSVSHGLRYLRRMGAIQAKYHARDRRDFYEAEKSLLKMVNGFVGERLFLHLCGVDERLKALGSKAVAVNASNDAVLVERINLLQNWNEQATSALAAALRSLR